MSASNQLIKKTLNENIKDELSCTQKCIILASISQDKKKILINSYDGIPLVKLYTANLKDDNFIYSKIKGALCFLYEEENNKKTYYLHIYEINYYSLLFSMQINQKMIKEMIELENNFICLPTKFHFLGFKFTSPNSMKKFLKMISCETDQDKKALDINLKGRDFKCSYKELSKVIKVVKSDFEKKFKAIDSASGKAEKEKDKNLFQRMDELYYLVNNITGMIKRQIFSFLRQLPEPERQDLKYTGLRRLFLLWCRPVPERVAANLSFHYAGHSGRGLSRECLLLPGL